MAHFRPPNCHYTQTSNMAAGPYASPDYMEKHIIYTDYNTNPPRGAIYVWERYISHFGDGHASLSRMTAQLRGMQLPNQCKHDSHDHSGSTVL